ncbi:MAG: hypothetical protein CMG75_06010 [Candidatus Marinimicrobia bacterium]|nr:hypothetical protein [Candidatus Neomarinimicrobiota bacterium]|tara:strand:+ start:301 stop:483 length:183 start_codon:yes stop_codon:yes gene_type:complete
MESILPNLSALEGKVHEAVEEIKRLKQSSNNSNLSIDKDIIFERIKKIIEFIEDVENKKS